MRNIGLGIICPTKYLQQFATASPYHLVLTHMVLGDIAYREFYRHRAECGDFITLDNSSYEVGDGVYDEKDLFEAASMVHANEIMAPETYLDARDTYAKVVDFVDYFNKRGFDIKVFATLHGKDMSQIAWLNQKYMQMKVATIGVSCRLDPANFGIDHANEAYRLSMGRVKIVRNLMAQWNGSDHKPDYHLLGMNFPAEISYYRNVPMVRSCDSSAAFTNGLLLKDFDCFNYEKPSAKIDFKYCAITRLQEYCIQANIDNLKAWGNRS